MDAHSALLRCLYAYVALLCCTTGLAAGAGLPPAAAAKLKQLVSRRRRSPSLRNSLIRLNPNADRRAKSLHALVDVQPTMTIIRSNVIGSAIRRIATVVDGSLRDSIDPLSSIRSPSPGTVPATSLQQLQAVQRDEHPQPPQPQVKPEVQPQAQPPQPLEQYRSLSPIPQHRRPPTLYPRDHESCRRDMRDVIVRRGGCRKRVSIGVCTGTCLSSPVVLRKHPYVNYRYSSCRPKDSISVEVSMNDRDCQQQRAEKGRLEREKAYNDVFLLSAVSCSCFSLPNV